MLWIDTQTANEAGILWSDEGFHVQSLKNMQQNSTWKVLHPAATALYFNLSYGLSWILNGGEGSISTKTFITGLRWTSYLSIQALLLLVFFRFWHLLKSWQWAFLAMSIIGMQRGIYYFAVVIHPEAPMLLGIVVALFVAADYLSNPRFLSLGLLSLAVAFSISSKMQAVFLLPWEALIAISGLWLGSIKKPKQIISWFFGALALLIGGMFLFTPYQLFHWQRLWNGLQNERNVQTFVKKLTSAEWLNYYIFSNTLIGYSYLFILLGAFVYLFIQIRQNQHRIKSWIKEPLISLFLACFLWLLVGAGYIFLRVQVLIGRYLIHVAPALMIMTFLGIYWIFHRARQKKSRIALAFLTLFVLVGLQQQTKHADFVFRWRERLASHFPQMREAMTYLKKELPRSSRILNPGGFYLEPDWFTRTYRNNPTLKLVEQESIDFLLLEKTYPQSLKREGVSLKLSSKSPDYQERFAFWNALIKDGVQGKFRIQKEFPDIGLTLYQRK